MRILFLSTSMGMGGADQQLLSAAMGLRHRGHEVRIVSLTPLGEMGARARAAGLATESLEMRRGIADPRGLARLVRLVRSWHPRVLHSHMLHANLMARAVRLFAPVPAVVCTIHNIYEGGRLRMLGYRLTNGLVDQVTIISQAAADRFVHDHIVPATLLEVVPNGVDTERYRAVAPGTRERLRQSLGLGSEFAWLAVGRFEAAKDYPNMLRAFVRVRAEQPGAVLLLVGRGSLQAETEALAATLGLEGRVRFVGTREDVPEFMTVADGYVMSSAWEGMPMVLLEAAAAGLPMVATRVGGNQEVIRDGATGFLVPPGDDGALGAAMLRLMALPETERRAMGARGHDHVRQHYGLGRVVDHYEAVYRQVLRRKGAGPADAA
ncbi:MAG TPA: glycosyltransferase [Gemmatimonadales bacterium]